MNSVVSVSLGIEQRDKEDLEGKLYEACGQRESGNVEER